MTFSIASELLHPLHDHVRGYGLQDVESGGFLLGPYDPASATVLALAEGVGIARSRGLFCVSGRAIDQLFAFADSEHLRVYAQVHAHPRGSFLSETDERDGFRVDGFISGVIPNYAEPPHDPGSWRWWTFRDGLWQTIVAPSVDAQNGRVVTFDETGVR
jgi:hypothetical protein